MVLLGFARLGLVSMAANWKICFVPGLLVVGAPSNCRGCLLAMWAAIDGCRGWRRRCGFVLVRSEVYRAVVVVGWSYSMLKREAVVREEDLSISRRLALCGASRLRFCCWQRRLGCRAASNRWVTAGITPAGPRRDRSLRRVPPLRPVDHLELIYSAIALCRLLRGS